jgi:FkbM family methyltransferase
MHIRDIVRRTPLEPLAKWTGAKIRYFQAPLVVRMNQRYDEQTVEIIRRTPGDYLDVGCHTGSILRAMIEISPNGRHAAFEPIPHLAERLRKTFPTVDVFAVALSDEVGQMTFNFVKNYPGRSGIKQTDDYPAAPDIDLITVRTDTIDNLIHRRIDLIKIDVEGAEFGVLKGATRTLRENRPIVVFEHGTAAKSYEGSSGDIFDLLAGCGLRVFLLDNWLRGKRALSRLDFIKQGTSGPNWYFVAAR